MVISTQSWFAQPASLLHDSVVRTENDRCGSAEVSLDFRTFAPLVPDMFFGEAWGDLVARYARHVGVLPSIFRVIQSSEKMALIVEMQVDAEGYGRVGLLGEVPLVSLERTLVGLCGRFSKVIIDDRIGIQESLAHQCVSDTDLHGRAFEVLGRSFGVDVRVWRERLCADIYTGRPLPTRAAMERVRGEVAVLVAYLQRTS